MDQKECFQLAQIYEKPFAYCQYNGLIFSKSPFEIKIGKVPILISAPHAVNHMRENRVKNADVYTGSLALFLHNLTNCFSIYSIKICEEDPNYIIGGAYKAALKEIVETYGIQYVIDLHGAKEERNFDIDLGTIHGLTMDESRIEQIKMIFQSYGLIHVGVNDTFPASHKGTITSFCYEELKVPSVQMEINRKFRNPEQNIDSYHQLICALTDIIFKLELKE